MGDTGPCGTYIGDLLRPRRRTSRAARRAAPDEDGDRFVEIWNLVFMQFEQLRRRRRAATCPSRQIDTGMGLERTAAVLQGVHSNYDIDLVPRADRRQRATLTGGAAERRATASRTG